MWTFITDYCAEKNLVVAPKTIHINFEKAMHKAISSIFPNTSIMCCRFHLGQNFWRKNQSLGLSALYKDKSSDVGKWLSKFFGLPFLSENEVKDSFAEDIMFNAPDDDNCSKFADYALECYIAENSIFPPCMWASVPDGNCPRTNNGPESFHAHFNAQSYARHPNIFIFLDVLQQIQTSPTSR